jgi:hypothetical protein
MGGEDGPGTDKVPIVLQTTANLQPERAIYEHQQRRCSYDASHRFASLGNVKYGDDRFHSATSAPE